MKVVEAAVAVEAEEEEARTVEEAEVVEVLGKAAGRPWQSQSKQEA